MNSLGLAGYGSSSEEDDDAMQSHVEAPVLSVLQRAANDHTAATATTGEDDELEAALARAGIPPEPSNAHADADVQERIRKYIATQSERNDNTSSNFQASLRDKKDVKNPYILEKVVAYFGIDELQSNFDPQVFDPYAMPLHEYSDALALAQKKQIDERQQMQMQMNGQPGRQLQFTRGAL